MILKGELITRNSIKDNEELEIDIKEFVLGDIELDKGIIKNIREKTAMLLELVDKDTHFIYECDPRPRFEISAGYKIALKKGARLEETKVYNLCFQFENKKLDGRAIALMYRHPTKNEEWILLLPDNTKMRTEAEREIFINVANTLVLYGEMDQDNQSLLIENLNLLNINERCAQSLIHEYGHILHWRMFDALGIYEDSQVYFWFYENGYIQNVDRRFPNFSSLQDKKKIHILKESLVEE